MKKKIILIIFIIFSLIFINPGNLFAQTVASEYLLALGKTFLKQGDLESAKTEFTKVLLIQPNNGRAKSYLTLITSKEKQPTTIKTQLTDRDRAILDSLNALEKNKPTQEPVKSISQKTKKEKVPQAKDYLPSQKDKAVIQPPEKTPEKTSEAQEFLPPTEKGAWTLPKGKLYLEVYAKYYWHERYFDDKKHKKMWENSGRYFEKRTEFKFEYGITNKLTALAYLPYVQANWKDDAFNGAGVPSGHQFRNRGLADYWLGFKYNLFENPFVFTIMLRTKVPGNYNENSQPSLGRKQIDEELRLMFGKAFKLVVPMYTKFEVGHRWRLEEPADEVPYFFELGISPFNWLVLKTTLDGVEGISGTGKHELTWKYTNGAWEQVLIPIEEDYTKWTTGLVFKFKGFNVETSYGKTFRGKNTAAAKEMILSLSYLF